MAMTASVRWRALGWLHVVLTVVFVIVTGNHYVIDVVAGVATAAVTWAAAALLSQRPHRVPAADVEGERTMVES
jgi:hypothetical protein